MERIEDHIEDALIDLGAVSVETRGQGATGLEPDGFIKPVGIDQD